MSPRKPKTSPDESSITGSISKPDPCLTVHVADVWGINQDFQQSYPLTAEFVVVILIREFWM